MKIRITSIPAGGAPLEVREQWVGVELTVHPDVQQLCDLGHALGSRPTDVASGEEVGDSDPNAVGFAVLTEEAIQALTVTGRSSAARWWSEFLERSPSKDILIFGQQFCEVVEE